MTAPTIHLTIDDRARELYATAAYVHTGDIAPDIAERIAVHNWIAATVPNPTDGWADYCKSVGRLLDLEDGLLGAAEFEVTSRTAAVDVARDDVARDLFALLFGPGAVPCQRCKQTGRDVWSPAVVDGLCCECQAIEWIGGRA